jgi:hypothetical protein
MGPRWQPHRRVDPQAFAVVNGERVMTWGRFILAQACKATIGLGFLYLASLLIALSTN